MSFSLGNMVSKYVMGSQAPNTRSTLTGAPQAGANLVQQPDGTVRDQISGQTYAYQPSANGAPAYAGVINPSTAQQVGTDANQAQGFYGQVPGYNQREAAAYGVEGQLAGTLNSMAIGQGPTVAGQQMQVGLDQAARTQMAGAAGASGSGAVLSRMAAMNNTANAQMNVNQQAGVQRAAEQQNAIGQLAGVTNNMQQQSQGMGQQQINAGQSLNALAMAGENSHEGLQSGVDQGNAAANEKGFMDLVNAGSSYASGKGSLG